MTEPKRWSEDDGAPPELRALLRGAHRARPLEPAVRERTQARLTRAAALPIGAVGWLSVKTALAAFGVTCGTAFVAVLATTPAGAPKAQRSVSVASRPAAAPGRRPAATPSARAAESPVPSSSSAALSSSVAAFPRQQTGAPAAGTAESPCSVARMLRRKQRALTAESELLERARRALRRSPLEALRLAGEHATRFPQAQLGSERLLIRIDALHRLGRDSEAQQLAQALLARSPDDLYLEHVRKLLGELE